MKCFDTNIPGCSYYIVFYRCEIDETILWWKSVVVILRRNDTRISRTWSHIREGQARSHVGQNPGHIFKVHLITIWEVVNWNV